MRVLMVNDVAIESGWGAEAHLARLADGLRAAGDTVEVFAGERVHTGAARALDVWDPGARKELAERAARFQPDVIHHHNVLRELSVSVLGVPSGTPTVMTVHEHRLLGVLDEPVRGPLGVAKLALASFQRRAVKQRVDVLIAVSVRLKQQLDAAGFAAVEPVPQFADPPPDGLTIVPVSSSHDVVMAGNLKVDKGVRELTEAFAEVASRHDEARLVVAGEGPEEPVLRAAQDRLGANRVQLLGKLPRPEVQALFARARVVAAPAIPGIRPEGAGTTPIEAALVGRPVIVSDDPGHSEFVDQSGGGLVVAAGSVPALSEALDTLLSDGELAQRLGDNARRFAEENRTTSAIVPAVQAAYRRAIALHGPRAVRR
ncbi:MAG: glycosyltransferase family 4 protein [Acidimicrobiia bacterium]|nr:glycosyltransferase family 4 protein [Acidimicrobiia bacterium]